MALVLACFVSASLISVYSTVLQILLRTCSPEVDCLQLGSRLTDLFCAVVLFLSLCACPRLALPHGVDFSSLFFFRVPWSAAAKDTAGAVKF
jgi:hypothetical protein